MPWMDVLAFAPLRIVQSLPDFPHRVPVIGFQLCCRANTLNLSPRSGFGRKLLLVANQF
jgi:hypothetical protein